MSEKTVLVWDDDLELVRNLSHRLEAIGLNVVETPDSMHVLRDAKRTMPSLILIGVDAPDCTSLSAFDLLAGDEQLSSVPIVAMSARNDAQVEQLVSSFGAHCVVKNDQLWESLKTLVTKLLDLANVTAGTQSTAEQIAPWYYPNTRPKILSIDDDEEISQFLKTRLKPYGLNVVHAFSGMQGFWTAIVERPDVVITDLGMPDADGNYVFRRLRMHPFTKDTPVIVLSGQRNPSIKREMLSIGVDGFLTKPIVLDELLGILRRHVPLIERDSTAAPLRC